MTENVHDTRRTGARAFGAERGHGAGASVAVVTGASAGIGRAVAVAFGRDGWRVALIARGRERLASAARDVEAAGGTALVIEADVADAARIEAAAAQVVETWGRIDVWVNNAMASVFGPVTSLTPDEIRRVTDVTYLGQVHGTLAALRHMRARDAGTIVQVGSALSYRSIPLQSAYCAAKAAVRGFTDSLRSELQHENSRVRLTMVQLPAVDTPQFDWARSHLTRSLQPVPPIHEPEPVADAIVRAARDAPREYWIGGPTIQAILGTMVAPGLLDRMMARRAWDGQMTDDPARPREGNLFDAPPGDPGTRGRFGARSRRRVMSVSGTTARGVLAATALGCLAGAVMAAWHLGARQAKPADRRLADRERAARMIG
ncbi:SDR family oxidoreductase [Microvirga subterranea]|uniref:Short-subunit dehydrogenase n=1 Tax=Microvirga subterranea TaxID=186651 RepID=A0A370HID3_9HYPH|nr:SDR family oxidoreductase [Microvirga subterranea]RDI57951.1 short-subunit dehydrogenase [Microvirga subterranea]